MTPQEKTLKELQAAIAAVDAQRAAGDLTSEQTEVLEMSAVALRKAERVAIAVIQKKLLADLEETTSSMNSLAKQIRARVTKMNKMTKVLDKVGEVIKEVVRVLGAVAKWVSI